MERACTVVVNPAAGRGRTGRLLPGLMDAVARSGLDHDVRVSAGSDDAARLARDAAASGRTIVACGGDGLVGRLAGVVADQGGRLAIVPTGSGNDFARTLGYDTRRPLSALDALVAPKVATVDLGLVDGTSFCCVASAGFDAEANRWANGVEHLGGTALYVAAALRTLARYGPRRFELTVDGKRHETEAWLVAVANAPSYGGGMRVAPAARVDDGLLECTVVGAVSRLEFLATFPKVFRGRHVEHPRVETFSAREVTIDSESPDVPVYADGESAGTLPRTLTIRPRALTVLAPGRP